MDQLSYSWSKRLMFAAPPILVIAMALVVAMLAMGTGGAAASSSSIRAESSTSTVPAASPASSGDGFVGQISSAGNVTCAITPEQRVICWGEDTYGIVSDAGWVRGAVQVSVGYEHACALIEDGTVECWGSDSAPPLPRSAQFVADGEKVATAMQATCVLTERSTVECWGSSERGLLPPPDFSARPIDLAGGDLMFCALLENGKATCWGLRDWAQRLPGASNVLNGVAIDSGRAASCVLESTRTLTCWGFDDGRFTGWRSVSDAVQISVGQSACALTGQGRLNCFGTYLPSPPAEIRDASHAHVEVGDRHGCVLDQRGSVTCWGSNSWGQLNVPSGLLVRGGTDDPESPEPTPTPSSPSPTPTPSPSPSETDGSPSPSPSDPTPSPTTSEPTPSPSDPEIPPDEEDAFSISASRLGGGKWRIRVETVDPETTFTVVGKKARTPKKLVWRELTSDDDGEFTFRTSRNLMNYRLRLIVDGLTVARFAVR